MTSAKEEKYETQCSVCDDELLETNALAPSREKSCH